MRVVVWDKNKERTNNDKRKKKKNINKATENKVLQNEEVKKNYKNLMIFA